MLFCACAFDCCDGSERRRKCRIKGDLKKLIKDTYIEIIWNEEPNFIEDFKPTNEFTFLALGTLICLSQKARYNGSHYNGIALQKGLFTIFIHSEIHFNEAQNCFDCLKDSLFQYEYQIKILTTIQNLVNLKVCNSIFNSSWHV